MVRGWDWRKDPYTEYVKWQNNLNRTARRQTWLLNTYFRYDRGRMRWVGSPALQKEYRSNLRFMNICHTMMSRAAKAMLD